jgi:hypothetical protein
MFDGFDDVKQFLRPAQSVSPMQSDGWRRDERDRWREFIQAQTKRSS